MHFLVSAKLSALISNITYRQVHRFKKWHALHFNLDSLVKQAAIVADATCVSPELRLSRYFLLETCALLHGACI